MDADGTHQENLTKHDADDLVRSWSPDGALIPFDSTRDGSNEIDVMRADGGT